MLDRHADGSPRVAPGSRQAVLEHAGGGGPARALHPRRAGRPRALPGRGRRPARLPARALPLAGGRPAGGAVHAVAHQARARAPALRGGGDALLARVPAPGWCRACQQRAPSWPPSDKQVPLEGLHMAGGCYLVCGNRLFHRCLARCRRSWQHLLAHERTGWLSDACRGMQHMAKTYFGGLTSGRRQGRGRGRAGDARSAAGHLQLQRAALLVTACLYSELCGMPAV